IGGSRRAISAATRFTSDKCKRSAKYSECATPGAMLLRRATVAFPRDLSRATATMRAPILASVCAATWPIPDVAPVMTTVLPFMLACTLDVGLQSRRFTLPGLPCRCIHRLSARRGHRLRYAVAALSSIGSTIEGVVVFRLFHSCGDRPHPHRLGWERSHQVPRVRLLAQPASVVTRCEDERHAIVNLGYQLIGIRCDDREGTHPLAGGRVFPALPEPPNTEGATVLYG